MNPEKPSTKTTVGGIVGMVVAGILFAADAAGVPVANIPPEAFPGLLMTFVIVKAAEYLWPERRPSSSARAAVLDALPRGGVVDIDVGDDPTLPGN